LDDQKVYKNVFHKGKWAGVFQFTEKGAQGFCKKAKPTSIIDISAITSIYRPGPLSAKVHDHYVAAKRNPKGVKYLHPLVKEVTKETHGFLIFQEQIALLAHKLGKNLTLDEGNLLRKLLTKKGTTGKTYEKKKKIHGKFIEGCIEKGIKEVMQKSFGKHLSISQDMVLISPTLSATVFLAISVPIFLLTIPLSGWQHYLDKEPEGRKERAINIVRSLGYQIRRPTINKSGVVWEIDERQQNS
jgi:DNA polymerase-3 subunit alpha